MNYLSLETWSPYIVGAGIGILSWITFLLSDKPLGCSTAFARTSGMLEKIFRGDKVENRPYYKKFKPEIDWEWMLVFGVIIGSFLSSIISGTFKLTWIPELWSTNFSSIIWPRLIVAFLGGILMGIGSRWAGGCTSGHGISGTLQMTVSSWIAAICFFISGILTAFLIFKVIAG